MTTLIVSITGSAILTGLVTYFITTLTQRSFLSNKVKNSVKDGLERHMESSHKKDPEELIEKVRVGMATYIEKEIKKQDDKMEKTISKIESIDKNMNKLMLSSAWIVIQLHGDPKTFGLDI